MSLKSIWKMLTIMVLVCAPMSTLYLTFWGESQARHLQTMSSLFHHHHRRSYCESGSLFKYLGVHIAHNLTRTTFTALQEKGPPTPWLEEAETCWLQCGHPDCLLQIWCGEHPHILYQSGMGTDWRALQRVVKLAQKITNCCLRPTLPTSLWQEAEKKTTKTRKRKSSFFPEAVSSVNSLLAITDWL